jgi:APA family basic amino acid/polyamine antiporter
MQHGIVVGILVVLFLYLTINYTYIKVIGFDAMKNANAIGSLLLKLGLENSAQKCLILLWC